MFYLISKLIICLLAAALLGLLVGWLLSRYLNKGKTDYYRKKLKSVENDHYKLAETLRDEKLEHQVSGQKYMRMQAQYYEIKREMENERYSAMRYKEMLAAERKANVDQRFQLERNLTQREIRIDDLDLDLKNTRLRAARDLNRLNGRLRLLASEDGLGVHSKELLQERDALKNVLVEREQELSNIHQQLKDLEQTDDQSTQELTQSAQMYSQLQDTYVSLNAEYERLTEHYVGLQGKFDDITQERDSLQTQIIDIGIKDEALERGMQSAGDEQGKLKAQLFSVTQEADQCQHRYQTLRDELQEQRTHCRSITEHFAGMDKALADSRMECTQLKERLDTLKP